jgi:hypothetical protein
MNPSKTNNMVITMFSLLCALLRSSIVNLLQAFTQQTTNKSAQIYRLDSSKLTEIRHDIFDTKGMNTATPDLGKYAKMRPAVQNVEKEDN